ncbi:helix-turn-helix transcriptional regulator [Actinokineospora sp. NBRC 105648]|uniref:helix-turn-helix transcriptional regulator n=1 Tax=Actinokineospora sp. NBRC 105648 TaxID=3032206 RepID=UPI003325DEBB
MAAKRHRLAARRKSLGLSQEALAERLNVDATTVGRWESGIQTPQPWLRPRIAKQLHIDTEQLEQFLTDPVTPDTASDSANLNPPAKASPRPYESTSQRRGDAGESVSGAQISTPATVDADRETCDMELAWEFARRVAASDVSDETVTRIDNLSTTWPSPTPPPHPPTFCRNCAPTWAMSPRCWTNDPRLPRSNA